MKKLFASILIICTIFTSLFAYDGMMWGEKDIRVSKTKWFDIVYPARCEGTARILYENADRIYEEIGEQYGYPPIVRMPVVIVPGVEEFNGYWTNGPYNHIVLYDTAMIEDLAVFSETFLSTFRHECTHAYTYNLFGKEMRIVTKILGDPMCLSGLTVSSGMAEGATVTNESCHGEGRLNDEYALQIIKQAALEDQFPRYWDVQGSSDIYPSGSFYYFNAAFHEWLQKEYGMQKYAQFWYNCVNIEALTQSRAFKKAYGISINKAWEQFEQSLKLPAVAKNPVAEGNVRDFFISGLDDYSIRNDEGARFYNLELTDRGLVYFDGSNSRVYFVPAENLNDEKIEPKVLFTRRAIDDISVSKDGRYIAVNYYEDCAPTVLSRTMIYDFDTKKIFTLDDHNYFHPEIVMSDGEYYLIRQTYNSPNYSIKIQKIDFSVAKFGTLPSDRALCDVSSISFGLNTAPFSFTDLTNGHFAYIEKSGLEYSICVCDLAGNLIKKFAAPKERMVIRYLSCQDGKNIYCSWTAPGNMPRLGKLDVEEGVFALSTEDISGGVYYPVAMGNAGAGDAGAARFAGAGDAAGEIGFIGKFYRQNRLFTMNMPECEEIAVTASAGEGEEIAVAADAGEEQSIENLPFEPYNPWKFYTKGFWYPFATISTTSYMPGYTSNYSLPYGVTVNSSNPWDTGSLQIMAGWGNQTNSTALEVQYYSGTDTYLLNYGVNAQTEFDLRGWKKVEGNIDIQSQYPFGKRSYIYGEAYSDINFGRSDVIAPEHGMFDFKFRVGEAQSYDKNKYLHWNNAFAFGFTDSVVKHGPGKFERAGINLVGTVYHTYWENASTSDLFYNGLDLQLSLGVDIPKLIPIKCKYGYTYNLPSYLGVTLFPGSISSIFSSDYEWTVDVYHTSYPVATARFDTLLFDMDFQKGCNGLFLYDLQLTASYAGMIVDQDQTYSDWRFTKIPQYVQKAKAGDMIYEDYAGIRLGFNWGINYGSIGNGTGKLGLYVEAGYAGIFGTHASGKPLLILSLTSLF